MSSNMFRLPIILHMLCGCWRASESVLEKMNLFAAGPVRKTVGLPKRVSLDMGPNFLILLLIHCSPVFVRMAQRRPRLWPMIGIPRDPGGSLFDGFLVLVRRWMVMRRNARRRASSSEAIEYLNGATSEPLLVMFFWCQCLSYRITMLKLSIVWVPNVLSIWDWAYNRQKGMTLPKCENMLK